MKRKTIHWLLVPLLILCVLAACQKATDQTRPAALQGGFFQKAKNYYQEQIKAAPGDKDGRKNFSPRSLLARTADWDHIISREDGKHKALILPLSFEKDLYIKRLEGKISLPTSELSRLLLYEDQAGGMHGEVVTTIPDDPYLLSAANQKFFSGTILVEDLQGNFLRGSRYTKDGKRYPVTSVGSVKRSTDALAKEPPDGCGTTDWYICASADGGNSWSCSYSHSEPNNCTGSGGETGGSSGGSGVHYDYSHVSGGSGGSGTVNPGGIGTDPSSPYRWPGDVSCESFHFKQVGTTNSMAAGIIFKNPSFGGTPGNPYKEFPLRPVIVDVPIKLLNGTIITAGKAATEAAAAANWAVKTLGLIYGENRKYLTTFESTYEVKFKEVMQEYLQAEIPGARVSYDAIFNKRPNLQFYRAEHLGPIDGIFGSNNCE